MRTVLGLLMLLGGSAAADSLLWYDRPATKWQQEALPIGNGRLGAMIFGAVGLSIGGAILGAVI